MTNETEKCVPQNDKKSRDLKDEKPEDVNDEKPTLINAVDNNHLEKKENGAILESSSAIENVFYFVYNVCLMPLGRQFFFVILLG